MATTHEHVKAIIGSHHARRKAHRDAVTSEVQARRDLPTSPATRTTPGPALASPYDLPLADGSRPVGH